MILPNMRSHGTRTCVRVKSGAQVVRATERLDRRSPVGDEHDHPEGQCDAEPVQPEPAPAGAQDDHGAERDNCKQWQSETHVRAVSHAERVLRGAPLAPEFNGYRRLNLLLVKTLVRSGFPVERSVTV